MQKRANNSQHPTLDLFEKNLQQFQETNKLLNTIEIKLTDFVNKSELHSPNDIDHLSGQGSSQHDDDDYQDIREYSSLDYNDLEQYMDSHSLHSNNINKSSLFQAPSQSPHEISTKKSQRSTSQVHPSEPIHDDMDSDLAEIMSHTQSHNRTFSNNDISSQQKIPTLTYHPRIHPMQGLSTRNYISDREKFEQTEGGVLKTQPSTNTGRDHEPTEPYGEDIANFRASLMKRAMKVESFYENKVKVLEERVQADGEEIFNLQKENEEMRLEIGRLQKALKDSQQAHSQEVWHSFHEQKESLAHGLGANHKSRKNSAMKNSTASKGDLGDSGIYRSKSRNGTEIKNFEGKDQSRASIRLGQFDYKRKEVVGNRNTVDKQRQSNSRILSRQSYKHGESGYYEKSEVQHTDHSGRLDKKEEEEKLVFMLGLINRYKQEVELLKENNVLTQQQMKQEITYLKKDLLSQREHNDKLVQMVQYEKLSSYNASKRTLINVDTVKATDTGLNTAKSSSHKTLKEENLNQMSREDLARYTKGLQDSYVNLEEQHAHQLQYNLRLQEDLGKLRENTKEEYRQFDEAYHKIFDGKENHTTQSYQDCRATTAIVAPVGTAVTMLTEPKHLKECCKENLVENSPPTRWTETPLKRRGKLLETLKEELANIASPSIVDYKEKIELKSHNPVTGRTSLLNESMKKRMSLGAPVRYDALSDEIIKVKRTVQDKIAEKGLDRSMNRTRDYNERDGGKGESVKDRGGSQRRMSSKGRTMNIKL